MDDREYKRLRKLILGSWSLLLVLVLALSIWGSYQMKELKSAVYAHLPIKLQTGERGEDGYTPQKGVDYFDGDDGNPGTNGKDSLSTQTVIQQPIYTNIPVPGTQGVEGIEGPEGPQGQSGLNGLVVFVRELTPGVLECRYAGNSIWQPIEDCGQ